MSIKVPGHAIELEKEVNVHTVGAFYERDSDGRRFVYAQANGALVSGKFGMFNYSTGKVTDLMSQPNDGGLIVKNPAAKTASYYSFYEIVETSRFIYENFRRPGLCGGISNTGLPTGTTGDENYLITGNGNYFQFHILGTQTILYPTWVQDVSFLPVQDAVDNDGAEWTNGITANSKSAFVVGTDDAFHFRMKLAMADISQYDEIDIGFRKAEAYQADIDNYDELAALNLNLTGGDPGDIQGIQILNGGATDEDDTTDTLADGITVEIEVRVSAAGVVTYLIDGSAPTTAPTSFTFDTGEVVIPFFHYLIDNTAASVITVYAWEVGLD